MTAEDYRELLDLRKYKEEQESSRLNKAFLRLEELVSSGHDPIMSRRSFLYIVEALVALKEELKND